MPGGGILDLSKYFSEVDWSHLSKLSEPGKERILHALQTEEQLKIKGQEHKFYGKHDNTTKNFGNNPENMSKEELKEGINDLLKEKKYNDLKNYLNGKDGVELHENGSLSNYSHTVKIYDVSLNIWEDGFGKGTICEVFVPNINEENIDSLRKIFSLLQSFKQE